MSDPYENYDYRSGTDGLSVKFGDAINEPMVITGIKLNLYLEVQNQGAYDISANQAKVILSGFDPNVIKFDNFNTNTKYVEMLVPPIAGKSPYDMDGSVDLIEFTESDKINLPIGQSYNAKFMATICYPYETIATPTVCVESSPQDMYKNKVCQPKTQSMTGQGAPVAVTKIDEEILEQKLNFVITIENRGDGKIFDYGTAYSRCPFQLKTTDFDVVNVNLKMSGTDIEKWDCNPKDKKVRLINNKGVIFCSIPVEQETSFTTPLEIKLDYGYTSSLIKGLEIIKPSGSNNVVDTTRSVEDIVNSAGGSGTGSNTGSGTTGTTTGTGTNTDPTLTPNSNSYVFINIDGTDYVCDKTRPIDLSKNNKDSYTVKIWGSGDVEKCTGTLGSKEGGCKKDSPYITTLSKSNTNTNTNINLIGLDASGKQITSESCQIKFS